MNEVLTLEEMASYLRLPEHVIEEEILKGQIPAKRIANTWRFLKVAVDDWLREPDGRTRLLRQAGALAQDDRLEELLQFIYRERDRQEAED